MDFEIENGIGNGFLIWKKVLILNIEICIDMDFDIGKNIRFVRESDVKIICCIKKSTINYFAVEIH